MSRLDREPDISSSEDRTLLGRGYKLLEILGDGSYAKVYRCQFTKDKTQTSIACKVIDTNKASKRFVKKFLPREIDILLKLDHPHIIHIHSILKRRNKHYIFMRYAERGDVLMYITKHGAVTERQARIWFRQLTLALQYLHELNIAHRDLKCENLLLTANYNIKIADFGFSRHVTGPEDMSETYCGSLSYSSPEVLKGSPYDPKRADIWACGVILYVLINRAMPFEDNNLRSLLRLQLNRCWWFRSKLVPRLSKELKQFLPLLLEPNPAKRPTVDKLTCCRWIALEPELMKLTRAEADALIKAGEMKKQWTGGGSEKTEIQPEGIPAEVGEEAQETVETPQKELETNKPPKKTAWHKRLQARAVCEVKPAESKTDLVPAGSLQHKYPWQKGKKEEMYVGDVNVLVTGTAAEETKDTEKPGS